MGSQGACLPICKPSLKQEWELHMAHQDIPITTEFITFLETRCKTLRLLQNAQVPTTTTASSQSTQSAAATVSQSSNCNLATQVQYSLCKGSHRLFKCDKFLKLQPKQHFNCAKQLGVCFNCWKPFT